MARISNYILPTCILVSDKFVDRCQSFSACGPYQAGEIKVWV